MLALPRSVRRNPRRRVEPKTFERGARLGCNTLQFIPADARLKPLRDQMIVEPLDVTHSRYVIVFDTSKPLRGIVKAVGPGTYPKLYDHPDKQRRTKMWDSYHFRPTEVKVGDIVQLGGSEIGGYSFETFYWGDKLHLNCTEKDVCGIECD